MKIGYTAGTFDLFHYGHLKLLQNAKSLCDVLIVGVNSDELVQEYKNKKPLIEAMHRLEIVRAIRDVDEAYIVSTLDKIEAYGKYRFDVAFIGDDWKGTDRWVKTEMELKEIGVQVCYLPYTISISTTQIAAVLEKIEREYNDI